MPKSIYLVAPTCIWCRQQKGETLRDRSEAFFNHKWQCSNCGNWIGDGYKECTICRTNKKNKT